MVLIPIAWSAWVNLPNNLYYHSNMFVYVTVAGTLIFGLDALIASTLHLAIMLYIYYFDFSSMLVPPYFGVLLFTSNVDLRYSNVVTMTSFKHT